MSKHAQHVPICPGTMTSTQLSLPMGPEVSDFMAPMFIVIAAPTPW
jgi:hypothetical protein